MLCFCWSLIGTRVTCKAIWGDWSSYEMFRKEGINIHLVGGFNQPLWKIWLRQLGWWNPQYDGKNNPNVPKHQPDHHHIPIVVGLHQINHRLTIDEPTILRVVLTHHLDQSPCENGGHPTIRDSLQAYEPARDASPCGNNQTVTFDYIMTSQHLLRWIFPDVWLVFSFWEKYFWVRF